jgi:hypothetical protein
VEFFPKWGAEIIAQGTREVLAECGLDLPQALQGPLATLVLLARWQSSRWRRGGLGWCRHPQAHPTDLEVFLEAVGLEEVGEF